MCPEILRNLMYECYLDLLIPNLPKDKRKRLEWLDNLDHRIYIVLSEVGVLTNGDDLEIGEMLI